jgi:hypothetical protein
LPTSEESIQQFIAKRSAGRYVAKFRLIETANTLVLDVPTDRVAEVVQSGKISRRQVDRLAQEIRTTFGVTAIVSFRPSNALSKVEEGVRALLVAKHPDLVEDVSISFLDSNSAMAWIVTRSTIRQEQETRVLAEARELLSRVGVSTTALQVVNPEKSAPSNIAILRSTKRLAPVSEEDLATDLASRGMPCPSVRWLAGKLDVARKRGWIVRSADGRYLLTAEGLDVVPHTRGRTGSDVERVLALAKRRAW